jgi:hypothetical protein
MPEIKNYVKENVKKARSIRGLIEIASEHFGMTFTMAQLSNFLWREGIQYEQKTASKPLYSEKRNSKGYVIIKVSMTGPKKSGGKKNTAGYGNRLTAKSLRGCVLFFSIITPLIVLWKILPL